MYRVIATSTLESAIPIKITRLYYRMVGIENTRIIKHTQKIRTERIDCNTMQKLQKYLYFLPY
jgi:hypothetical protein